MWHQCQQNNVTLGASWSLVRGLYLISLTHYDVLSLLFKLLNLILYLKTLNSLLCYFLLNIVIFICFCTTYFFDKITLCMKLPNVTLSNMWHLVYITLFGENDGVILSRLGCISFCKFEGVGMEFRKTVRSVFGANLVKTLKKYAYDGCFKHYEDSHPMWKLSRFLSKLAIILWV